MQLKIHNDSPRPDIALSYDNIGSVFRSQGDYSSALKYHLKSLDMLLKIYGDSPHSDIAVLYNNIGSVYHLQGNYSSALNYHQKSLDMQLEIHSDSPHPDIAVSHCNIGNVYRLLGDYNSALTCMKTGLAAMPPGLSPDRTAILENIHMMEQTINKLVHDMVRVHSPSTSQLQSYSPTVTDDLIGSLANQPISRDHKGIYKREM